MIRLANMPVPHANTTAHSVFEMFRSCSTLQGTQRVVPASELACGQGLDQGQDATLSTDAPFISPKDWDDLFLAIQTRLDNCVGDTLNHTSVLPLQDQKLKVKKTVQECVEALRHLHQSVTLERQSQRPRA